MRNIAMLLMTTVAIALLASAAFYPAGIASAQTGQPVGVVVAYVPGQSITIADQSGTQHEYVISSAVKILPPGRANSLATGSFVTIIAPASLDHGKQTAVGIVVHPHTPPGWNVPTLSATPAMSATPIESLTPTLMGTLPATTETGTATVTGTPDLTETVTPTGTITVPATDTPTPTATATPSSGNNAATTNSLIEWLRSLFRQLLASR